MKFVNWTKTNKLAVQQVNKFAVYVANGEDDDRVWEFVRYAVFEFVGSEAKFYDAIGNILEGGLFFFDTEDEARKFYNIFTQELTDSSAIYAALYKPDGICIGENT